MATDKPRHIRDIAHLYLSGRGRPARKAARCVLVAGIDRECFTAFHVVNLAAAFSARGYAVRLAEISDEPLNTGFFLSLPPAIYVDPPGDDVDVSALGQVTLAHSFAPDTSHAEPGGGTRPVHLIHLPPVEATAHDRVLRYVVNAVRAPLTLLYLTAGNAVGSAGAPGLPAGSGTCVVDVRGARRRGRQEGVVSLGRLDRWHSSLGDPIPPVVRDPQSVLSRSYQTLCEALVSPTLGSEERSTHEESNRAARGVRTYRKTRRAPFRAG